MERLSLMNTKVLIFHNGKAYEKTNYFHRVHHPISDRIVVLGHNICYSVTLFTKQLFIWKKKKRNHEEVRVRAQEENH